LCTSIYSRIAVSNSLTLRNTPRRIRLFVSSANHRRAACNPSEYATTPVPATRRATGAIHSLGATTVVASGRRRQVPAPRLPHKPRGAPVSGCLPLAAGRPARANLGCFAEFVYAVVRESRIRKYHVAATEPIVEIPVNVFAFHAILYFGRISGLVTPVRQRVTCCRTRTNR
jgi:hypothetical protein